jgi:tight adherence protein C
VTPTWLIAATGTGTLLLAVAAFMLMQMALRQRRLAVRIQMSRGQAPPPAATRQEMVKGAWSRVLATLGQLILRTGLLSSRTRAELELTLMSAGLRGRNGLEIFIGGKIGLVVGLPLLAALAMGEFPSSSALLSIAIPIVAAVLGLLLPDMVVRYRRKRYIQRVERGLPDALDLLVICSQAGLGLTSAIVRVAEEMQHGNGDIGLEFALTANELQLMADSRLALSNLGSRTGVDGLIRLGTTLIQSLQYGTPLTDSMRVLSAEMRRDTLTRFEARAARLGVLLTLPMIVFILPCVFLIVGGPAAIQVLNAGSQ